MTRKELSELYMRLALNGDAEADCDIGNVIDWRGVASMIADESVFDERWIEAVDHGATIARGYPTLADMFVSITRQEATR